MTATGTNARADKVISLDDVRSFVPDGASLFLGGFTLFRSRSGWCVSWPAAGRAISPSGRILRRWH